MTAGTKKLNNISVTIGSFPIIVVTCLYLTLVDFLRLFSVRNQFQELESFW